MSCITKKQRVEFSINYFIRIKYYLAATQWAAVAVDHGMVVVLVEDIPTFFKLNLNRLKMKICDSMTAAN